MNKKVYIALGCVALVLLWVWNKSKAKIGVQTSIAPGELPPGMNASDINNTPSNGTTPALIEAPVPVMDSVPKTLTDLIEVGVIENPTIYGKEQYPVYSGDVPYSTLLKKRIYALQ